MIQECCVKSDPRLATAASIPTLVRPAGSALSSPSPSEGSQRVFPVLFLMVHLVLLSMTLFSGPDTFMVRGIPPQSMLRVSG